MTDPAGGSGTVPPAPMGGLERERKVTLAADVELPDLSRPEWTVASGGHATLVAEYHDTADLRLLRWGVTLRRRTGGADEGWHLKLPADDVGGAPGGELVRDELRAPLAAGGREVPGRLVDVVRALVRSAPVVPVATVHTGRTTLALLDDDGPLVEVVDDRVRVTRDGLTVAEFREVEVENLREAGTPEERAAVRRAADAVVAALVEAGGVPQPRSKLAVALAPLGTGAPDVVVPPLPRRHDPARDAVAAVLAAHVRSLLWADVSVRRERPDAVHQLRVAARRLRTVLRAFRPVLDREWARGLRAELAWAADGLGAARDTEVFRSGVSERAARLPADDRAVATACVDAWATTCLAEAWEAAHGTLGSDRYVRLLDALVDAARTPRFSAAVDGEARDVLVPLVRRPVRRLARAVAALGPESTDDDWHHARILAKRARYAADAVVPVAGTRMRGRADALSRVTDVLGQLHDTAVARATLREIATGAGTDGRTGFALGLLAAAEADRAAALRDAFADLWQDAGATLRRKR